MSDLKTLLAQRQALDAQIAEQQAAARAAGIAQVRELMAAHGLTLADLAPARRRPGKSAAAPGPAVYRAPDGKTWTGKGRPPAWIPPVGPEREALRVA